jgi:hypothetical protein
MANAVDYWKTITGEVLPYVQDHRGIPRLLACLPPREDRGGVRSFKDAGRTVIPRADIVAMLKEKGGRISFADYYSPIRDQGQHGSCVGHGAGSNFQKRWSIKNGTQVLFSPCFIYALGNGGRDAGMVISDALDILTQYGICHEDEFPEGHIWKQQIPAKAYETAKRYRATDSHHCQSYDEIMTTVLEDGACTYGIYVGRDFNNLNSEGVAPAYPRRTGNHCVYGDGLILLRDGSIGLDTPNSWDTSWGINGRCVLTERHFDGTDPDAFGIDVTAEDPQETNLPPKVA